MSFKFLIIAFLFLVVSVANGLPHHPHTSEVTTCGGRVCPQNTECVKPNVQCVRAPCPESEPVCQPIPIRPEQDPCAGVRCGWRKTCVVRQAQCVRATCPPLASCE